MGKNMGRNEFNIGHFYEGYYLHDKGHGYERLIWNNGDYYIGNFKDNSRNGCGKFF